MTTTDFDIIPVPPEEVLPEEHSCLWYLPNPEGALDGTGHPVGTLIRCPSCSRWNHSASVGPFGECRAWLRVRWYHFRLRSRIDAWELERSGGLE